MSSASVPAALAPATVNRGRRFAARVYGAIPFVLFLVIYLILLSQILFFNNPRAFLTGIWWLVGASIVLGMWSIANLVMILVKSRTIAAHFLGFEYRRITDAKPSGGLALAKLFLTDLLGGLTLGIFWLLTLIKYRDGQTIADRWLGVVAVYPHKVAPPNIDQSTWPARVQPVTMPTVARNTAAISWETTPEQPLPGAATGVPNFGGAAAAPVLFPQASPPQPVPPATEIAPPPPPRHIAPPQTSQPPEVPGGAPGLIQHTPFAPAAPATDNPTAGLGASTTLQEPGDIAPVEPMATTQPEHSLSPDSTPATVPTSPFGSHAVAMSPQPNTLSDETVLDQEQAAVPQIRVDDGTQVILDEPVVFGRNPVTPQAHPDARPHPLVDESMKLSKTHLVVFAEDQVVKVYDVGARNGVIFEIDGQRAKIAVAEDVEVPPGATVHFGGRSLRVMR